MNAQIAISARLLLCVIYYKLVSKIVKLYMIWWAYKIWVDIDLKRNKTYKFKIPGTKFLSGCDSQKKKAYTHETSSALSNIS